MRWYLTVWDADDEMWIGVGWVNDGVNDRIRLATIRGLLLDFEGGQVDCQHPESKRRERYALDGDGTIVRLQRKPV